MNEFISYLIDNVFKFPVLLCLWKVKLLKELK